MYAVCGFTMMIFTAYSMQYYGWQFNSINGKHFILSDARHLGMSDIQNGSYAFGWKRTIKPVKISNVGLSSIYSPTNYKELNSNNIW